MHPISTLGGHQLGDLRLGGQVSGGDGDDDDEEGEEGENEDEEEDDLEGKGLHIVGHGDGGCCLS